MSPRIIVAPITSSVKNVYSFEVKAKIQDREGKILLDQIHSVDKQRLCGRVSILDKHTMQLVDRALKISLALT